MAADSHHPTTASMAGLYDRLWADGDAALRSGTHVPDAIPVHGDPRWGLSVVLRIDGAIAERIAAEAAALAEAGQAPHLVYRPEDLHCTIRSLEGFQDEVPQTQVDRYADQLRRVTAGLGPLRVAYRGLGGAPGGVFVRGFPDATLWTLRERLHADQQPHGPWGVPSVDIGRIRATAHVSVVVFRPPAVDETKLAEVVSARAEHPFGTVEATSLSLVRYTPTPSAVVMEELARVSL
ncbi:2'-5' RNA ligase family protein [Krasilnikovia sp. M28-CT-15]|uniref:2'-5' RNA ligase family protein n=1 Tax=Krasilnikovia sp. M28-CT-15 TaxID=3373540 RepID=UPI003876CF97